MNISQKKIDNCKKLTREEIFNIAKKLKIDYEYDSHDDETSSLSTSKLCSTIKKTANKLNPCGNTIYGDTDLTIKPHQLSVANHLIKFRGAIVVHSVGTGKTLSAIASAQCLLIGGIVTKIIVCTPTSLQENFKNQMRMYGIDDKQFKKYIFYTIQKLVNDIDDDNAINPTNSLLIIDESHNLRTFDGLRTDIILKYSKKAKKVLLLTATPIINYAHDIINGISMVNGTQPISIDEFNKIIKNKVELKNYVSDIFSFYIRDKPDVNFPQKKILEIYLQMDDNYAKLYEKVEKGEVERIPDFRDKNIHVFYNGLRRISNILEKKSPKVDWIINKIKSEPKAKYVIFSHFINMGIKPVMKYLEEKQIKYKSVTGDMSVEQRGIAVSSYNSGESKILFISKAGSEGLDLKNTTYIIIMESTWNQSSIEQIIGRGVRYKSHDLLPDRLKIVTVYQLYLIKQLEYKNINNITNNYLLEINDTMLSVDLYLRNYSWLKQQKIVEFFKILQKYGIK